MSRKLFSPLVITLAIIAILVLGTISSYNSLVTLEEQTDNAFANIETQYQRRFDLIPNVVNTVEGVADFEQETLQNVVAARSAWAAADTTNGKIDAANGFESALSRLLVTVEAYPELKATQAFRDLITELEGTENRIAYARNEFNAAATEYNTSVRKFPRNLIANLFNFEPEKELFKAAAEADVVPVVDFGNNQ
ncbi:MAG: LemA family protein [Candidatus Peribacteraceae bacterium]|nr:LemA family protein [Candidatus Peribacteraceae bacterium]